MSSFLHSFRLVSARCFTMLAPTCSGHYTCLVSFQTGIRLRFFACSRQLGVVTCPGIFPMAFTVLWRRQNTIAAITSPVLGLITGMAVWLGTAQRFHGEVTVSSTGQVLPCVYGTVASAFSPILYSVAITYLAGPQNYDWADFQKERLALEKLGDDLTTGHHNKDNSAVISEEQSTPLKDRTKELKRWGRIAAFWSIATFLGHWVLWPLPMYAARYIFSKGVGAHHLMQTTIAIC